MKIKKCFASLLSLFTVCSFTCSGVVASKNSVDDMATLPHQRRKRHNAIAFPRSEIKAQFIAYKEEDAVFAAPGMKKVTINDGVRIIDKNAFFERNDIDEIVIPKSVEVIDDYAFIGCKNLRKVVIQGEVSIGQFSFLSCKNLVEILIEGMIKTITATSFFECNNLRIIRAIGCRALNDKVINTIISSKIEFDEFGNAYSKVLFLDY